MVKFICSVCHKHAEKSAGHYNRAMKLGANVYCSKSCSSEARRFHKTDVQKKREKAEYDRKYRYYNKDGIKKKKAEAFKKDYAANPEKYKKIREAKMASHVEYCRQPRYKEKKKTYDHRYRLERKYGEFWEAASILVSLSNELDSKQIKYNNGIINKSQKRKRQWNNLMQNH